MVRIILKNLVHGCRIEHIQHEHDDVVLLGKIKATHKRMLVISSLVWFALIAGFVVFAVKKPKIERLTIVSVSIALVVVQAAGAVGALADQSGEDSYRYR